MRLQFVKYHGAGNDFILVDGRSLTKVIHKDEIARLCHRHYGIGADGFIVLYPDDEQAVDFRMEYFNADGRESSMCGNGARCAFDFGIRLGLVAGHAAFRAYDGLHQGRYDTPGQVTISMGDVPEIRRTGKQTYILNTGSPHIVRFVTDLENVDVYAEGKSIRSSPEFVREGINVNFVQTLGDTALRIRTYERGVEDLTLACGTGVTAAALAYADRQGLSTGVIQVQADGGRLSVSFRREAGSFVQVFLTGPVKRVFEGTIELFD